MRIDPVPALANLSVAASKDNNPLIAAEVELRADGGSVPVPGTAEVQSAQGSKPNSSPSRGEVAWNENPRQQVYRVVDDGGEIVFQIPSKQVLDVAEQIDTTLNQNTERELDVRS